MAVGTIEVLDEEDLMILASESSYEEISQEESKFYRKKGKWRPKLDAMKYMNDVRTASVSLASNNSIPQVQSSADETREDFECRKDDENPEELVTASASVNLDDLKPESSMKTSEFTRKSDDMNQTTDTALVNDELAQTTSIPDAEDSSNRVITVNGLNVSWLVGKLVRILWKGNEEMFKAMVVSFNEETRLYKCWYGEDNSYEDENLLGLNASSHEGDVMWEWLDESQQDLVIKKKDKVILHKCRCFGQYPSLCLCF